MQKVVLVTGVKSIDEFSFDNDLGTKLDYVLLVVVESVGEILSVELIIPLLLSRFGNFITPE